MTTDQDEIKLTIDNFLIYAQDSDFSDLHFKVDPKTGLLAIIAIHSTKLGPAIGGCRWLPYASHGEAIYDAMRLARGMSYKSALLNLPFGGGKAVIIKPEKIADPNTYFSQFADFVHSLGGRYITAVDVGTTLEEMDIIYQTTPYVASLTQHVGEPSAYTALGVCRGIESAVEHQLKRDSLSGLHIAIQGLGKVGMHLSKLLHQRGAKLTVADINPTLVQRAVSHFGAATADAGTIHQIPCDVFSPNALGGIINKQTIPEFQTSIIAGGANNQLAQVSHGQTLQEKNILYAPDYVINSGGLIYATTKYQGLPENRCEPMINHIYDALLDIFAQSSEQNQPPSDIADHLAQERLA